MPFLLWWIAEKYRQSRERKEYLYYLERVLVDQINMINDADQTIRTFLEEKLGELLNNIQSNPSEVYSVDQAFFPMFSLRSLGEEVHLRTTKSSYVDNKIGQSYKLSKDMPLIADDLRRQFSQAIEINKEISFSKSNAPGPQRKMYISNIESFREAVTRDMLEKNIPIYIKTLVETRVALNSLAKMGLRKWRWQFDPRFRFFITQKAYKEAAASNYEKMSAYFVAEVEKQLLEIRQQGE